MIIYILIFLSTSFFAEISVRVKNRIIRVSLAVLSMIIPSYFAGIRYGIGTDYFSYKYIFENIKYGYPTRMEPGYEAINYVVAKLGGNVQIVFLLISFLTILFIYLSLYDNRDKLSVGMGMLVFMLLYYQLSFNAVRQVLAISILLYSYKYIFERKLFKFFIFVLIAISFHSSSIIFLPVYFVYTLIGKKDKKIIKIIIIIITVIVVLNYNIIVSFVIKYSYFNQYRHYIGNKDSLNMGIGLIIKNLPYILPGIYLSKEIKKDYNRMTFILFIFILGVILSFTGEIGISYADRIALNFTISNVILIPYYIRLLANKRLNTFKILIIIYVVFRWYYILIYIGQHQTIPYRTIYSLL